MKISLKTYCQNKRGVVMAHDLASVIDIVEKYSQKVRAVNQVYKVFLFGSYAKGNAADGSDIDVYFF